ncbi:MAG: UDP-N-acetyl glucosamine 2-epimerase, partial [Parahaliea sp.]
LRSGDRAMPEEINRILTDQLSDLLFTTEAEAEANLVREGIDRSRVHFVGNVMIDSLRHNLARAVPAAQTLARLDPPLSAGGDFGLLTLHRPSNVDEQEVLASLLNVLADISAELPLVFPVHPRTRGRIDASGWSDRLAKSRIHLCEPLGYHEMLGVMRDSKVVFTDSGGLQEETTALGVPCVTLRHNTERPITVTEGTNTIVGTDPQRIMAAYQDIRSSGGKAGRIPSLWDGQAAERIAGVLGRWLHDSN